jgi:eukaryotic-like serine/threonine-protein kinase
MRKLILTLSEWQLDESLLLGKPGGFGSVFSGSAADGTAVAIKLISLDVGDAAHRELEFAQAFVGRATQNIIPILDYGVDQVTQVSCIVMSRADETLREVIRKKSIDLKEAVFVIQEICRGLIEAGDWTHRDLKPENILRYNSQWQIADFGIARIARATTSTRTLKDRLTPPYAAPEQWNDERASHSTDIYALGCIGIELLTGKLPFPGPAIEDFAQQHRSRMPTITSDVAPGLRSLLFRMTAKTGVARPTADQVISELEYFTTDSALSRPVASKLSNASAMIAEQTARAEAAALAKKAAEAERDALEVHAYSILRSIAEQLFAEIARSAPQAKFERQVNGGIEVYRSRLGDAEIRMTLGNFPGIAAFGESKWNVICGDAIVVERFGTPEKPRQIRSASLWYAEVKRKGSYGWIEVAYWSLNNQGHQPTYLTPENAAAAASPILQHWHLAYNPKAIEGRHSDDFCQRWMDFFAEAVSGTLYPSNRLPEEPLIS